MSDQGIQVFLRVRPPIKSEIREQNAVFISNNQISLKGDKHDVTCRYDHVWDEIQTQVDVFNKIQPLLDDVMQGFNGCIFAYGQTSAGKTHTMLGPQGGQGLLNQEKGWGLLPRSAKYLFEQLENRAAGSNLKYHVKASFLQIYNEGLFDLLRDPPKVWEQAADPEEGEYGLKIREIPAPGMRWGEQQRCQEVFVSGLSEFRVQTADDVLRLLAIGSGNRETRATAFNQSSSRSHAILQLSFEIEASEADGTNVIHRSKLSMVDLAGSEKLDTHDDNSHLHMRELSSINKSLSSLGNVIAALSNPTRPHIPYRDSKLTRLLQDSLGGNTRTILIACVAPTVLHSAETASTLAFADRAKNVIMKVRANIVVDDKMLLTRAYAEIERLRELLRRALERGGDEEGGDGGDAREGIIKDMVAQESAKFQADVERLSEQNKRLSRDNELLRQQLKEALNRPSGRDGGPRLPLAPVTLAAPLGAGMLNSPSRGEGGTPMGGPSVKTSPAAPAVSASGAAHLSARTGASASSSVSYAADASLGSPTSMTWFEQTKGPMSQAMSHTQVHAALRPLGAGLAMPAAGTGQVRRSAHAASKNVYLTAAQQKKLRGNSGKGKKGIGGTSIQLAPFPGDVLESSLGGMQAVRLKGLSKGTNSNANKTVPGPSVMGAPVLEPRAPAPLGSSLPRSAGETDEHVPDESEEDFGASDSGSWRAETDTPPAHEVEEDEDLSLRGLYGARKENPRGGRRGNSSKKTAEEVLKEKLQAAKQAGPTGKGPLKHMQAIDRSLMRSAKNITAKLQNEEANLENIQKMKRDLERQLVDMQARRSGVGKKGKSPGTKGGGKVPKNSSSSSPSSSSSAEKKEKTRTILDSPQKLAMQQAHLSAHQAALSMSGPKTTILPYFPAAPPLAESRRNGQPEEIPVPIKSEQLKGAKKKRDKKGGKGQGQGRPSPQKEAAAAARREEEEEEAAAQAAVAAALEAALFPGGSASGPFSKPKAGALSPLRSVAPPPGKPTEQQMKKSFNSPPRGVKPGLKASLPIQTSMEELDKENAMARFNEDTLGAQLLMTDANGPSIYEQLEAKKKLNASPDRSKPLEVGKRMELFSTNKNCWEKFTVVEFESSKGLYKCSFNGGRVQWLNLRQKQVREV